MLEMLCFMKDFVISILIYVVVAHSCPPILQIAEAVRVPRPFQDDRIDDMATVISNKQFEDDAAWHRAQDNRDPPTTRTSMKDHRQLISTGKSLSPTRRIEIQRRMRINKKQMEALKVDYTRMNQSIERLEKKLGDLKEKHLEALKNRMLQHLEEIRLHHRSMLLFVQFRMYELSGAGTSVLEAQLPKNAHREITKALAPMTEDNSDLYAKREPKGFLKSSSRFGIAKVQEKQNLLNAIQIQPGLRTTQATLLGSSLVSTTKNSREVDTFQQLTIESSDDKVSLHGDILQFLWDKVMEGVPDMTAIIRCTPLEGKFLSGEGLEIKILFEQCVLEAKQFEYKHNFIRNDQLNHFFMTNKNLELAVVHIYNLFYMDRFGFAYHQTFVPEMKFLRNHWYTDHLHEVLKGLSKIHQGIFIHKALLLTIRKFNELFKQEQSTRSFRIHESFTDERFHFALDKVEKSRLHLRDRQDEDNLFLKDSIGKMIDYYQRPNPLKQEPHPSEKIEYLINHYILSYLRTYHEKVSLRDLVDGKDSINYELFEKQFALLDVGLEVHQILNLMLDRGYIPVYSFKDREILERGLFREREKELSSNLVNCLNNFSRLKNEMNLLSLENPKVLYWMNRPDFLEVESKTVSQAILKFLNNISEGLRQQKIYDNRNLWLIKRNGKLSSIDKLVFAIGSWFEKFLMLN